MRAGLAGCGTLGILLPSSGGIGDAFFGAVEIVYYIFAPIFSFSTDIDIVKYIYHVKPQTQTNPLALQTKTIIQQSTLALRSMVCNRKPKQTV